jgi:hypothetical protein
MQKILLGTGIKEHDAGDVRSGRLFTLESIYYLAGGLGVASSNLAAPTKNSLKQRLNFQSAACSFYAKRVLGPYWVQAHSETQIT